MNRSSDEIWKAWAAVLDRAQQPAVAPRSRARSSLYPLGLVTAAAALALAVATGGLYFLGPSQGGGPKAAVGGSGASGSTTPVASGSATPVASGSTTPVVSGSASPVVSGAASPVPSGSCETRTGAAVEWLANTLPATSAAADTAIIGTVQSIGPARWDTPDGSEPTTWDVMSIYRVVQVKVTGVGHGSPAIDQIIGVRFLGGTIGCKTSDPMRPDSKPAVGASMALVLDGVPGGQYTVARALTFANGAIEWKQFTEPYTVTYTPDGFLEATRRP